MSGRLLYIDPLEDKSLNKLNTNDIVYPYEDYSMAIDLTVKIADRYKCGWQVEEEKKVLKFSSSNGSLSFLKGDDINNEINLLTTKYTDVSFSSPLNNTNECLGIESIDIVYNSWMYPQVTIKFIDVRGASIMTPSEASLNCTNNDNSSNNEFFKSFFTFPYPMFELKVKGFYGKGVTYTLAVQKTNIDFDSQNGSFIFSVNFIGYMYGIFADFPITYAAMAPYLDGGKEYWERQKKNGRFKFITPEGLPGEEFHTLPELKSKIARLLPNSDDNQQTEEENKSNSEITNNVQKIDALRDIKEYYIFNSNGWSRLKVNVADRHFFYKIVNADYDISVELKNLCEFIKLHSQYDNDDFKYAWNPIVKDGEFDGNASTIEVYDLYSEIYDSSAYYTPYEMSFLTLNGDRRESYRGETLYNNYSREFETIANKYDNINLYPSTIDNITPENPITTKRIYIVSDATYTANYEQIDKEIKKLSASSNKLINEIRRKEEENKKITKILGFNPSIKNIYNLIFAHIETFMHCFYTQTLNISKQLDGRKRDITYYGLDASMTDIPNNMTKLPPYFACFERDNKNNKTVHKWVGDLVNGEKNLEEVKFIHQLLNATELYFKNETELLGSGNDASTGETITVDPDFIPITKYDIYINDSKNPYKNAIITLQKGNAIDLLRIFFIRTCYFYASMNGEISNNLMTAFINIEVYNAIKATESVFNDNKYRTSVENIKDVFRNALTNNLSSIIDKNGIRLLTNEVKPNFGAGKIKSFPIGVYTNIDGKSDSTEGMYIPSKFNDEKNYKTTKIFEADILDSLYTNTPNFLSQYYLEIDNAFKNDYFGKSDYSIIDILDWEYIYPGTSRTELTEDSFIKKITMVECFATDNKYSLRKVLNEIIIRPLLTDVKVLNTQDIYAKAFLFLASIPLTTENRDNKGIGPYGISIKDAKTGIYPKFMLLKEGAHYWKRDVEDDNIFGIDNNLYIPKNYQTLTAEKDDYNGIHFFASEAIANKQYETITIPYGTYGTNRVEVLKNYFINWVKTEYKNYDKLLNDKNLYDNNDEFIENFDDITLSNNRDKLQNFLKKTLFEKCFLLNTFDNIATMSLTPAASFNYEKDNIKKIIDGFGEKFLKTINTLTPNNTLITVDENNNTLVKNDALKDAKLTTYITLKMLYDKWLCSSSGYDKWKLQDENSIFNSFKYVDSYYNDIGDLLNVNIEKISAFLYDAIPSIGNRGETSLVHTSLTIYDFLIRVAEDCGGMLLVLPNKFGDMGLEKMSEMFKPHSIYDAFDDTNSTFLFMYTYKPSEHLGDRGIELNGWKSDGLDLDDDDMNLFMAEKGYNIPAFKVSFAQQNQSIFKNIRLNTESAGLTEPAISAMYQIASKGSEVPRQTTIYGQDLYKLYTSYSYKCEVSCMGNMEIMPMMLFQLNNIPMWRGAYQIFKVSHNIRAGNINTSFEGMRMNKYAVPFLTETMIMGNIDNNNRQSGGNNLQGTSRASANIGDITEVNDPGKKVILKIYGLADACYLKDVRTDCYTVGQYIINNLYKKTCGKSDNTLQVMYAINNTYASAGTASAYYYSGATAEEIIGNYERVAKCIEAHIDEGIPIIVGVNYKNTITHTANKDWTTDHYVVIFGYEITNDGAKYLYYETGRSYGSGCIDKNNILKYVKGKINSDNTNFEIAPSISDSNTNHRTITLKDSRGVVLENKKPKYDLTHVRPVLKTYKGSQLTNPKKGTIKYTLTE